MFCLEREKAYRLGLGRDQLRDKSESKYQRVQDKSETIEKRLESETGLEYYSPGFGGYLLTLMWMKIKANLKGEKNERYQ